MAYILKNKNIEIHIDLPLEGYNFSRFDWTGKIVEVKFQNKYVTSKERTDAINEHHIGKGFYNEFGIDSPLGFKEANTGEWFHKIGVGLLKKEENEYFFMKKYEIIPAEFSIEYLPNKISIKCTSQISNKYGYVLKKEIELFESSFVINYFLQNTGDMRIITDEYNHNFIAIDNDLMGTNYNLKFPFQLKPKEFMENVNLEQKVDIEKNEIKFNKEPNEQFFFRSLTGGKNEDAMWKLINTKSNVGIRETGSFQTNKINVWGWKHVISPELFFKINLNAGQSVAWTRTYDLFNMS